MANQLDLPHHYRQHLETLLREHLPTVEVWAYGSRVNGQSLDGSDLDLVLRSPGLQPIPIDSLASFSEALQESTIPFLVEVHDWARLPESCHPEIEREHLVLVAADSKSLDQQNSGMEGKWRELCWGDLATLEYGRALRGHNSGTGPIRVFGTNGPIGWHDEALCSYPSVVVGRKGAYRGVHYSAEPFFVIDTAFYLKPKVELDTRWAYYQLLTQDINGLDSGSAIPSTRREDFYNLPVQIPPLPEQRTIAQILGTLDDKIELNRQLNETLEELVRAIFKDWFVDFGPVRAKLEGRDTGLPEHLAELFPDRLVESELGEIPEGWGIGCAGDIFEQLRNKENPFASPDAAFHHFSIPAFDEDRRPKIERGASIKSQKSQVLPGVVLLSKLNPEIERVWLVDVELGDRAVCSTEFLVLRPRPPYGRAFVYCLTRSFAFRQKIQALVTGTSKSHQRARAKEILDIPTILPPTPLAESFESMTGALLSRTIASRRESRTLTALRDTLLPKLVSGEVQAKKRLCLSPFPS